MTELDPEPGHQPGLLLHGWKGIAQGAAMVAVALGAGVAIYAERATVHQGLAVLPHLRVGWLLAGLGAECVSMIAFGLLQRYMMLQAGGARVSFGAVLLVTGNPAAAVAAIAIAVAGVAAIAAVLLALRFPAARSRLVRATTAVLRVSKRLVRWPSADPAEMVENALDTIGGLRLGWRTGTFAFTAALVNWLTDVACLICALKAAGGGVPWSAILIVWTAGAGAASFSPSPAGLGVVDIVLIAALSGAGIAVPIAVAAVVLYRIATFKIVITAICLAYPHVRRT